MQRRYSNTLQMQYHVCIDILPLKLILRIRQSAQLLEKLPPDIQRFARDAYAVSLERVFILAACSTLLAYVVRIPVGPPR